MIDQVNGIDHPVRGFFGVHLLRGQSFISLAVADAFMMSVESGPDAISPSLPVVDYPTREEAEALTDRSEAAAERAEQAAAGIVPPLQLDAPPTTSTVGSVGQLATWHDSVTDTDHLYHLVFISTSENATLYHWEECVLLDSNGLVPQNVLPKAGNTWNGRYGVVRFYEYGVRVNSDGYANVVRATNQLIDAKNGTPASTNPIVPSNLNYAVRSVLPLVTEIPAATSDYSLVDSSATTLNHSHTFVHTPTQAPTYRLPSVSDTTISHYIELTVDFTNVQTYSFLDYQGEPIVPLFTPAIAAGDVYTFKCEYSNIKAKWLIYPQKQGAVADDFVMRGEVGAANGVAGLDDNGLIPPSKIPKASGTTIGGIMLESSRGLTSNQNGQASVVAASNERINGRTNQYNPIVPSNLNYAVTAALTDSKKISLTDAQKAAAQEVFGVGGAVVTIPAATTEYTLSWGRFAHSPSLASVYVLPAVADGSITNDITLSIKFSSTVLTYEFQDSAGNTLVPLPLNGDIEAGSVVTFLCSYEPLLSSWTVMPVVLGKVEAQP
jgi:hypothetical protein